MEDDEDFSLEDEEDESTSPTTVATQVHGDLGASIDTLQAPLDTKTEGRSSEQSSPRASGAEASRRQSSEYSYDVVSSQVSASGDPPPRKESEDEDSDWE